MLQLTQVSEALKVCSNDAERASLENLKCDLEEILDLTRETLNELRGPSTICDVPNDAEDLYAKEMALFLAEINKVNEEIASKSADMTSDVSSDVEKFKVISQSIANIM